MVQSLVITANIKREIKLRPIQSLQSSPGHGKLLLTAISAVFHGISSGLEHRGKLDGNADLQAFAHTVERVSYLYHSPFTLSRIYPQLDLPLPLFQSCIEVVENGIMTKDLAGCVHGGFSGLQIGRDFHTTDDFMQAIDEQIQKNMA